MTTKVIINPGTEPVEDATVENATFCIEAFLNDLQQHGDLHGLTYTRNPEKDGDGRFGFTIGSAYAFVEVEMPGCEPERTMKSEPWYSPRLYVADGSWLWGFGLGIAESILGGEDDDDA